MDHVASKFQLLCLPTKSVGNYKAYICTRQSNCDMFGRWLIEDSRTDIEIHKVI